MSKSVLVRKVSNGYIVSSAVQAPGDEHIFNTLSKVFEYIEKILDTRVRGRDDTSMR